MPPVHTQNCGAFLRRRFFHIENQHGVIHVLAVSAVEEAELLLAVGGIVGGVEVEQNLAAWADVIAAETDELLAPGVAQAHQVAA